LNEPISVCLKISGARWTSVSKVLFRFAFCYFLLYAFCGGNGSPLGLLPGIGASIDGWIQRPMDLLAQWVGVHLFHLTGRAASMHIQMTGDGALRWVAVAVFLTVAILATVVWSLIDRRREEYVNLLGWSWFVIRMVLGVALLKYGFIKVFPIQFGPPPLAVLNEPVGNSSVTTLFWSVYGLNPTFVMTLGWTEVVAGLLLLFRKTAFAGAVLALGVMANVALLNLSFDVPVKLYSLSLVAMSLVLLAPEFGLLARPLLDAGTGGGQRELGATTLAAWRALSCLRCRGADCSAGMLAAFDWNLERVAIEGGCDARSASDHWRMDDRRHHEWDCGWEWVAHRGGVF